MESLVTLALLGVGLAFAFSIGAHYTGACVGMPYAAGALRTRQALFLMAPLTFLGAALAATGVEETVGHGLLGSPPVPLGLALAIVASALLLTTLYNFVTLPTSTIQILVFSVVGAGLERGLPVEWHTVETLLVLWALAPFAALALAFALVRSFRAFGATSEERMARSGRWASALVLVGGVASFAMGANDVSNATGAFVMSGLLGAETAAALGGLALAAGVLTWGRPLLEKVAFHIVRLDRAMATAAQFAQAGVILVYVAFGYFTSMNQALVGAMIGAGWARGQRPKEMEAVKGIALGWAVGPLSALALGAAFGWCASLPFLR